MEKYLIIVVVVFVPQRAEIEFAKEEAKKYYKNDVIGLVLYHHSRVLI